MTRRELLGTLGAVGLSVGAGLSSSPVSALCASAEERWGFHGRFVLARPRGSGFVLVHDSSPMTIVPDLSAVRLVGAGQTPHLLAREDVNDSVVVLRTAADLAPGTYALRGVGRTEATIEITDVALPAVGAPRTRPLRRERSSEMGSRGRTMSAERLVLDLTGTVPVGAVVVAAWTHDGEAGTTWAAVNTSTGHPEATLASVGRCSGHGNFPPVGASITVRYIDAFGQVGPPSRALRVPR